MSIPEENVSSQRIEQQLAELSRRTAALPDIEEPPPTTLQVLGQSRQEQVWQRILVHLLNSDAAHGLDDDLLEHLLTALAGRADLEFDYSRLDLENVRVQNEVSTDKGQPDLLIWVPDEWFLCVEMKLDDTEQERQTQRYAAIESFSAINLETADIAPANRHYIYLAPAAAAPPEAPEFVSISWEWLTEALQSFLAESHGRYPSRTRAQLTDFIDTVRSELDMTEYEQNKSAKTALAIEYYDSMTETLEALDDYVSSLNEDWPAWFVDQTPAGWNEHWHARLTGNSYRSVYRDEWAINYPGDDSNNSSSDLHTYWQMRVNREYIGQQVVKNRLVVTGEDEPLLDSFRDAFLSDPIRQQVTDIITDLDAEPGKDVSRGEWGDRTYKRIINCEYQFDYEDGDGFKRTAVEAFEDLQPIFELVTEAVPTQ